MEKPYTALSSRTSLVIVAILCLLPYLNFGPLSAPSQVQPWAALLAWLWVAGKAVTSGLRVTGMQWLLLAFAVWFMLDVYGGEGFDLQTYLRRSAAFLLSAGIFLACQYLTPATLWRALKFSIPLWLAFAVLRYVSEGLYFAIVTPLVPTVVRSAARGTSSLAPEATDFGFTMAFIVVLCMITRRRLKEEGARAQRWPLLAAVAATLLSQSGSGYLALALIGVLYLVTHSSAHYGIAGRVVLTAVVAIPTIVVLDSLTSSGVRGIDLLSTAIRSPMELMDTTVSYRVAHNVVGWFGLLDSDLGGYGAGAFVNEATQVYQRYAVGDLLGLTGYYADAVPLTLSQSPVSQFAVIVFDLGIMGVIYLVMLFAFAIRSQIPYRAIAVAILFVSWFNSFPAGWPLFWVLVGVMMSPHFRTRGRALEEVARPC
ncbi:hypothetical protein [Mycolicibacterium goodii]